MSDNMLIYNALWETPAEARKTIQAGRLKGFTDINPMWRFKRLTEIFGACGVGWRYEVIDKRIIEGGTVIVNGEPKTEQKAFVDINLYYNVGGEWSAPIFGTGGASYVSVERNGLYTNDECFKMALTDAIGTACKALGMSADIYFSNDRTKYIPTATAEEDTEDDDVFGKINATEEKRIKDAAKAKWGKDTPNKIQPILVKYGATFVKDLTRINIDKVMEDIANAD